MFGVLKGELQCPKIITAGGNIYIQEGKNTVRLSAEKHNAPHREIKKSDWTPVKQTVKWQMKEEINWGRRDVR